MDEEDLVMEEDLACVKCHTLEKENRRLKNRIVTHEEQVSWWKRESRRYKRRGNKPCKKVLHISSEINSYSCFALDTFYHFMFIHL